MAYRYFKSSPGVYQMARQSIDDTYGYPNGRATTSIDPSPRETGDLVVLALPPETHERPEILGMIDQLLGQGAAEEITAEEYRDFHQEGTE